MDVAGKRSRLGLFLAGCTLVLWIVGMPSKEMPRKQSPVWTAVKQELAHSFADWLCGQFIPGACEFAGESSADWLVRTQTGSLIPLYGVIERDKEAYFEEISKEVTVEDLEEDDLHGDRERLEENAAEEAVSSVVGPSAEELMALMEEENRAAAAPVPFVPREQVQQLNKDIFANYEDLVEQFYTIDASTMAGTKQLNLDSLLGPDVSVTKREDGPQILIYHTHSQEAFADSVPGDTSTSIVGVGERLAEILREDYGYQVLHHTGQYDVDSRDDAYGKSLPALKQILEENPTIEVVIDLHRDQMPEETKLVMDLDGRPTARFMFFNGLSRTRQSGDIDYLQNDNIEMNLAMSFQMQLKCQEYYPGLTRKIYLKGYRYNMHLCPRTLLVELGAQNNTVEEAMNACDPLAHVLHMVLSGE